MFAEKQASLCRIGAAAGLFVLAGILNRACAALSALPSAACFLLSSLSYVALALAWGFSVSQRVLSRSVRRYLLLGCGMAVLWLLLRAAKYRYFTQDVIARHLWYLYYVPQTLATLFSLMGALWLGRDEGAPPICRALQPDILLMEVSWLNAYTLQARLKLIKQLRADAADCKFVLPCDENSDAELARQMKIARQDRRIDAFFYTSVTPGYLTAAIDAL